jgi:tetratricopeptide (TPR) repeat protein
MSEMQDHFKDRDVTFVGVSNEEPKVVQKFLKDGWDAKMRYTVAMDDDDATNKAWMTAAGQKGIPCAFVVKAGKVEWIGHPMNALDLKVAELCGDTKYAEEARKIKSIMESLQASFEDEKWDKVIEHADKFLAIKPGNGPVGMLKYRVLVTKKNDTEGAAKYGREFASKCDDAQALNEFAWIMLTEDEFADVRDVKLALSGAKKAMELSEEKDAAIIDTYARALVDSGDLKKGIEYQKKAVELAKKGGNPTMVQQLEEALEGYEKRFAEGI